MIGRAESAWPSVDAMVIHHSGGRFRDGIGRKVVCLRPGPVSLDVAVDDAGIDRIAILECHRASRKDLFIAVKAARLTFRIHTRALRNSLRKA